MASPPPVAPAPLTRMPSGGVSGGALLGDGHSSSSERDALVAADMPLSDSTLLAVAASRGVGALGVLDRPSASLANDGGANGTDTLHSSGSGNASRGSTLLLPADLEAAAGAASTAVASSASAAVALASAAAASVRRDSAVYSTPHAHMALLADAGPPSPLGSATTNALSGHATAAALAAAAAAARGSSGNSSGDFTPRAPGSAAPLHAADPFAASPMPSPAPPAPLRSTPTHASPHPMDSAVAIGAGPGTGVEADSHLLAAGAPAPTPPLPISPSANTGSSNGAGGTAAESIVVPDAYRAEWDEYRASTFGAIEHDLVALRRLIEAYLALGEQLEDLPPQQHAARLALADRATTLNLDAAALLTGLNRRYQDAVNGNRTYAARQSSIGQARCVLARQSVAEYDQAVRGLSAISAGMEQVVRDDVDAAMAARDQHMQDQQQAPALVNTDGTPATGPAAAAATNGTATTTGSVAVDISAPAAAPGTVVSAAVLDAAVASLDDLARFQHTLAKLFDGVQVLVQATDAQHDPPPADAFAAATATTPSTPRGGSPGMLARSADGALLVADGEDETSDGYGAGGAGRAPFCGCCCRLPRRQRRLLYALLAVVMAAVLIAVPVLASTGHINGTGASGDGSGGAVHDPIGGGGELSTPDAPLLTLRF